MTASSHVRCSHPRGASHWRISLAHLIGASHWRISLAHSWGACRRAAANWQRQALRPLGGQCFVPAPPAASVRLHVKPDRCGGARGLAASRIRHGPGMWSHLEGRSAAQFSDSEVFRSHRAARPAPPWHARGDIGSRTEPDPLAMDAESAYHQPTQRPPGFSAPGLAAQGLLD
jgi:hypothetical protein